MANPANPTRTGRAIKRGAGERMVEGASFRLTDEVRYVQRRAAACDGRIVTIGQLLLFSTDTGDAMVARPLGSVGHTARPKWRARSDPHRGDRYCARHRLERPLSHRWTGVRVLGSRQRAHRHNPRIPNRQARCNGLVGKFQICLARSNRRPDYDAVKTLNPSTTIT